MTKKNSKLYKIGYLTKKLDITPRTVRYYDQFGLLPHVKRSDGGVRLFDEEDIEVIRKIRHMQKNEYLPLDVIKERLFGEKKQGSNEIVIVTDSTASLPAELIKLKNITVIPLKVSIESAEFQDGINISPKLLWEKSKKKRLTPTAQAPNVEAFVDTFLDLKKKGAKEIFSIHLSSVFSDTVKNAEEAALRVNSDIQVRVINANSTGAGLGLLVNLVADSVLEGSSSKEIDLLISKNLPLVSDIITANSIDFLFQSDTKPADANSTEALTPKVFLMNKVKQVKPVLNLNPKTGELELISCCLSQSDAFDAILEIFQKEVAQRGGYVNQITVIYGHLYGEAIELVNRIKEIQPNTPISLHEGSAVLSTYVGPEILGVSFI